MKNLECPECGKQMVQVNVERSYDDNGGDAGADIIYQCPEHGGYITKIHEEPPGDFRDPGRNDEP